MDQQIEYTQIKYLLSLKAIRERARIVWNAAESGELTHFEFHKEKLEEVADFVASVIKVRVYAFFE
jgi:hypothetical protein